MTTIQEIISLSSLRVCDEYEIERCMAALMDEYDPEIAAWYRQFDFDEYNGRNFFRRLSADVVLKGNDVNHDNLENRVVRLSWDRAPFALVRTRDAEPDNDDDSPETVVRIFDRAIINNISSLLSHLRTCDSDVFTGPEDSAGQLLKFSAGTINSETGEISYEKVDTVLRMISSAGNMIALARFGDEGWAYGHKVFSRFGLEAEDALKGFMELLPEVIRSESLMMFMQLGQNSAHIHRDLKTNSVYVCTDDEHTGTQFSDSDESTNFFLKEVERCGRKYMKMLTDTPAESQEQQVGLPRGF